MQGFGVLTLNYQTSLSTENTLINDDNNDDRFSYNRIGQLRCTRLITQQSHGVTESRVLLLHRRPNLLAALHPSSLLSILRSVVRCSRLVHRLRSDRF